MEEEYTDNSEGYPDNAGENTDNSSEESLGFSENTVFIGKKPTMAYVFAVMTQFEKDAAEVMLKARGKSISKAVDVTEIVKNKFPDKVEVTGIQTSTEEMQSEDGKSLRVSAIEVRIARKDGS